MKIADWKSQWLVLADWEFVESVNEQLCAAKNALHRPTSDGYELTRQKWISEHEAEMSIFKAVELCRECHRLAPFCFFNGNTFVAVIRQVTDPVLEKLDAGSAFIFRSVIGHCVAGTLGLDESSEVFASLPEI